jgi:peptidoglycan lytic transglycosylase B
MMRRWMWITALLFQGFGVMASHGAGYADHPLGISFADKMAREHGFRRDEVLALLAQAERKQSIIDAMTRPAEKVKPWKDYRLIFIQERRIDEGVDFWRTHRATLNKVSEKYGVDPAIIVAIIGVETYYGRITGSYRVVDALSTLAFDYPKRSPFFTKELENFLLLTREQNQDPLVLKGSYAGAMGYGQFMPSSYRHYAVDYDDDQFIDIWTNPGDAIASVANYFVRHGWQTGKPVVARAEARAGYSNAEFNKLQKPVITLAEFRRDGLKVKGNYPASMTAFPMKLEGDNGDEYWLGFDNFYAITRYNHSHRYAMAVYQLSELIRERMGL